MDTCATVSAEALRLCGEFKAWVAEREASLARGAGLVAELDRAHPGWQWHPECRIGGNLQRVITRLRQVGEGKLSATLVEMYRDYPARLDRIALLSRDEQCRLERDEPVEVLCGKETVRRRPSDFEPLHWQMILGRDGMRTIPQQAAWLQARRERALTRPGNRGVKYTSDGTIIIHGECTPGDLRAFLQRLERRVRRTAKR